MTQSNKSILLLERLLIITSDGKIAYDENFHRGVNIIRGDNGGGKSTISDFIFYALGGDFNNWKKEASDCQDVYAQISINRVIYTTRRTISLSKSQSMAIYRGEIDSCISDYYNGWQVFPYKQTDEKISFSNFIFSALGYPEVKAGEAESNMTLHQVLRLIYIDQESPTLSLFKYEPFFDSLLTRVAIEDLLLGIYDDSLYNDKLELKKLNSVYDSQKKELKSIETTFRQVDQKYNFKDIDSEIENIIEQIKSIDQEIGQISNDEVVKAKEENKQSRLLELQNQLAPIKNKLYQERESLEQTKRDIIDSSNFIQALQNRVSNVDQSINTRELLGKVPIKFCPNCYSEVNSLSLDKHHCYVCKEEISEDVEKLNLKRIKQEMVLQIEESKRILRRKEENITNLEFSLSESFSKARNIQSEIDLIIQSTKSSRNEVIEAKFLQKGKLIASIDFLEKYAKMYKYFEELNKSNLQIQEQIEVLDKRISGKIQTQSGNRNKAVSRIKYYAAEILKNDLPQESEFSNPVNIDFSSKENVYSLNGRLNYSASSNVILKNAIRFAFFYASTDLDFMRFPRFILCDNIEDKGMQSERSHNFQRLLVEMAEKITTDFQLIFSTSMIAPELNNSRYCVGPYYDSTKKSLKF